MSAAAGGEARWWERLSRSRWPSALVVLFFVLASLSEVHKFGAWKKGDLFSWDIEGYHHYLPALIIHGGVGNLAYVDSLDARIHEVQDHQRFGIHHIASTGKDLNKFTCGVALFNLPGFLIAHAYARCTAPLEADGYSRPYQVAVTLSTVFFAALGLLLLLGFLLRHVNARDATVALTIIAFGTNLFFYGTLNAGMSHAYVFFLFTWVLWLTDQWHREQRMVHAVLIGLAVGWSLLTRPTDGLIVVVPLLWRSGAAGSSSFALLRKHPMHLVWSLLAFLVICLPQLLYWKHVTGSYIHYSYHDENFDFAHPHILEGLFSYRKGWLLYHPLVAIGLVGLVLMLARRGTRAMAIPLAVYITLAIYVVFSWEQWWYGGSFGCRPLVPALALLALPMAEVSAALSRYRRWAWIMLLIVVAGGIKLNMFQQDLYRKAVLHWSDTTKERYWDSFSR